MNQYLKDICELCEFTSPVTVVQYIDGKRKDVCFPKWKLIATHAARRTFICTALAAGIAPQVIMKYTGHSDYKAMKPYIEVAERTKDDAMKTFSNYLK
jgi:integrase